MLGVCCGWVYELVYRFMFLFCRGVDIKVNMRNYIFEVFFGFLEGILDWFIVFNRYCVIFFIFLYYYVEF